MYPPKICLHTLGLAKQDSFKYNNSMKINMQLSGSPRFIENHKPNCNLSFVVEIVLYIKKPYLFHGLTRTWLIHSKEKN